MPPKSKITKEEIAEKALEIMRNEGYEALNARNLAKALGVSTMPLFHHYENMDEIRREAVYLGGEIYNRYINEGMKDEIPFKGVGRAYIRFATEEPELFRAFFMMPTDKVAGLSPNDPNHDRVHGVVADIMNGDNGAAEEMFKTMWLLVHGIAVLQVTGKTRFSDEDVGRMLSRTFKGLKATMLEEEI